jgi:hypothetical protein
MKTISPKFMAGLLQYRKNISIWIRGSMRDSDFGLWILRLRLRLRAEWQGGRHTAKSDSFRTMKTNRKEIWCRIDWLGWCCVHRFWIDPVPIVFGMMLWEFVGMKLFLLVLDWWLFWFWIDAM